MNKEVPYLVVNIYYDGFFCGDQGDEGVVKINYTSIQLMESRTER